MCRRPHCLLPDRFRAWLGQKSSHGKQRRLLDELYAHTLSPGAASCQATFWSSLQAH